MLPTLPAGIGATLGTAMHEQQMRVVIKSLAKSGTGHSSGMLKVGDVITRVGKQDCSDLAPDDVHALLQGEAGTVVKVRYLRPPAKSEMTCTLLRETGTEHLLDEKHTAWKKINLTNTKAEDEEARRRADALASGEVYQKINATRVHHNEDRMTVDELAKYQARRRQEDEANIKHADEFVARLSALDDKENATKAKNEAGKNPDSASNPTQNRARESTGSWLDFGGLFAKRGGPTHHKEWWDILPEHKDRTRSTRLDLIKAVASPGPDRDARIAKAATAHKAAKMDNQMHDFLHGKEKKKHWWDMRSAASSEETRQNPGEHHWPWESRSAQQNRRDEAAFDRNVPMPWDLCAPAPRR